MSQETLGTAAAIGTFIVIAATAIAALIQLRHMRSSNQIVALTECRETLESREFVAARRFVARELPELLKNLDTWTRLGTVTLDEDLQPVLTVANFFEYMGSFVKHSIIDREIACDFWSGVVVSSWAQLASVVAHLRLTSGMNGLFENFEYMAVMSEDWMARNRGSSYPKHLRRMKIDPPPTRRTRSE